MIELKNIYYLKEGINNRKNFMLSFSFLKQLRLSNLRRTNMIFDRQFGSYQLIKDHHYVKNLSFLKDYHGRLTQCLLCNEHTRLALVVQTNCPTILLLTNVIPVLRNVGIHYQCHTRL